ncbi:MULTISPECIES: glycosyltransferase family 2 protein [Hyphomonas]|nr:MULTISPECIES: glycosyltransferase family 2 protein [Hyphomonas]|tara:strand:- start:11 stop:994 length:984 start_codon:yes stop_codon:yes gene_type:complete
MRQNLDPSKVAIVIPLYNDEPHIERAILSALKQECPSGISLEVIVVDDCSTDSGYEIAKSLEDVHPNLRVLKQSINQGPSAARNLALSQTDAGWFTPQDSDDIVLPDRLSKLLATAIENNLDWVADNLLISQEASPQSIERNLWPEKPDGPIPLTAEFFVERSFEVETPRSELGFIKPLFNRLAMKDGDSPYLNELRFGEDFELYTRLLLDGTKAWLIDPCGYYLVQRAGSASHSQAGRDHRRLAAISARMSKRPGISPDAKSALKAHAAYSQREAAIWAWMDGVRQRDVSLTLSAFSFSVDASLNLLGTIMKQVLRKLLPARSITE